MLKNYRNKNLASTEYYNDVFFFLISELFIVPIANNKHFIARSMINLDHFHKIELLFSFS